MKSQTAFFRDTVLVHESSRHSVDRLDTGNWIGKRLIGSKYGVTGAALAAHRKVPASSITFEDMANLTEAEAIDIGLQGYYIAPPHRLDRLPWDRVTASVVDLSFNAGPRRAAIELQKLIGVAPDDKIGPMSVAGYYRFRCDAKTEEEAARRWCDQRLAFYRSLNNPRYIKGWTNRARSFLPGTAWWKANA